MTLENNKSENWSFQKEAFNRLIAAVDDAVIVFNPDFNITGFNASAEKLFGVKAKEVIGKTFSLSEAKNFKSNFLAQVMFPSLAPTVVKLSEAGAYPQVLDVSLEDPQKELRIITDQITNFSGEAQGFIKIVKDKTRERDLLRSKSEFITIAAHQLRTPTTGLTWALDSLVKEKNLDEPIKETLNIARKTAHNLLKIINDLVTVAQIEEGKFGYSFEKINLSEFLEKVLMEADLVAREYNVKLYFDRPKTKELTVSADVVRLGLVVSNLIDNAIKYNVPNGEVTVGLKKMPNKQFAEVSVKDTGVGIPKEDIPKLFTKFFRSKNVERFAVGGSGLGLYLAKNIIEKHGGEVWVESVLNRGSVFTFTLPLS